jgi:hypothetical protein
MEREEMANNFGLTKKMNFTQKGDLIRFRDMGIRQHQEVVISWGPADNARGPENWKIMKNNGQLPPSVKMVFLLSQPDEVRCVEISAVGGPGFQNVTHETFALAGNPVDIATEALRTWLIQEGENVWTLVPEYTIQPGEEGDIVGKKEARDAMFTKVRGEQLMEIAKTYAENYPRGTEAVRQKFGLSASTAVRRRTRAIELGYLPPTKGSSKKDYEKALLSLQKKGDPAPKRSNEEVKELLKKMKEGNLDD